MSNRKCRIDPSPSAVSPTRSTAKAKSISKSKSNNTTNAASSRLPGIEEVSQSDSGSVPFILVDGMCTKNRQQLHLALSKCEKRRMKWIQRQCCVLPLLKYIKPAAKAEPTTTAEKDAKEEVDFQEDLKQLCIAELSAGDSRERTGTVTPIAHATSAEDLLQNKPRLEEIRFQLEQLRQKQEQTQLSLSSDKDLPPLPTEQPKLLRQGTFDVKQEERLAMTPLGSSLGSSKGKPMDKSLGNKPNSSQHQLIRAVTMNQPRLNSPKPTNSTTCLFKNKSYTLIPDSMKTSKVLCSHVAKSNELPKIISQIGDLLLQLPLQQQEQKKVDNGSYTYLVTITPNTDNVNSDVEMITTTSPLPLSSAVACTSSRSTNCKGMSISSPRNPAITIFAPSSPCGSKTAVTDTNAASFLGSNQMQNQPPPIQPKARTFLNMSSRLLKKIKN